MKWAPFDIVMVLAFVVIGRLQHNESIHLSGVAHTYWPFLIGALVGWAILAWVGHRRRIRGGSIAAGATVWLATIVGGMSLRAVSGHGVEIDFIIAASVVVAVFLLVPRLVVSRLARR